MIYLKFSCDLRLKLNHFIEDVILIYTYSKHEIVVVLGEGDELPFIF